MKERLFFLLKVILAYVGVFAIGKIAFMAAHWTSDDDASLADALAAIWNGLSLDVTIALYLLSVPFLVVTVSVFWKRWQWLAWLLKGYFAIMALPVVLAIVADNVLYRYWGIKLDASVLQFLDTTGAAFTSISWWAIILLIIVIALGTWGIAYLLNDASEFADIVCKEAAADECTDGAPVAIDNHRHQRRGGRIHVQRRTGIFLAEAVL